MYAILTFICFVLTYSLACLHLWTKGWASRPDVSLFDIVFFGQTIHFMYIHCAYCELFVGKTYECQNSIHGLA